MTTSFQDYPFHQNLLQALSALDFKKPSPVQEQVFAKFFEDKQRDIIALAQTGTGKTAAFGLPILQQIIEQPAQLSQVLILSPTRELALQITKALQSFCTGNDEVKICALVGGVAIEDQIKKLKKGNHVFVGTPGRINDLLRRKALQIKDLKTLVLDEADEMLTMGFREEIDTILEHTPEQKQTLLFSATMSTDIQRIANTYMSKPWRIEIKNTQQNISHIQHFLYCVEHKHKYVTLRRILDTNHVYGVIFCRTRRETQTIAMQLIDDGYKADALHGDLSQMQRNLVMQQFRSKKIQLLVATDVAARGVDVADISHVIHMDIPREVEIYMHRSGRTGRAGKTGESIAIATPREKSKLKVIENNYPIHFIAKQLPTPREVACHKVKDLIDKIYMAKTHDSNIGELIDYAANYASKFDAGLFFQQVIIQQLQPVLSDLAEIKSITENSKSSRAKRRNTDRDKRRSRDGRRAPKEGKDNRVISKESKDKRRVSKDPKKSRFSSRDTTEKPREFNKKKRKNSNGREFAGRSRRK